MADMLRYSRLRDAESLGSFGITQVFADGQKSLHPKILHSKPSLINKA
jgi:hypothetical protein